MRKRFYLDLAASGIWPGPGDIGVNERFNWVKVDNRGGEAVDVSLNPQRVAGTLDQSLATISAAKVRTLNVAGPAGPNGEPGEDWPNQLFVVCSAAGATTVLLEVADHPIVDIASAF